MFDIPLRTVSALCAIALVITLISLSLGGSQNNVDVSLQAQSLFNTWEEAYGLYEKFPPLDLPRIPDPAPHLQLCHKLNEKRIKSEKYDENGNPPQWTRGDGSENSVQPPWIRGGDDDNLPHTRFVQTELWKRQFPRNCSDPSLKFSLVEWAGLYRHGLGSALHIFALHFATSVRSSRIVVPLRKTFVRTIGNDCIGHRNGSLDCYFFPITSPECEERAHALWKSQSAHTEDSVVIFRPAESHHPVHIPSMGLHNPWNKTPMTIEVFGKLLTLASTGVPRNRVLQSEVSPESVQASWWYSQAIRFMLRWPTPYMCHIVNKMRNEAYGLEAASEIVQSAMEQEKYRENAMSDSSYADMETFSLAEKREKPFPTLDSELWWQEDEPYLPRPIVSIHIRQGDKGKEMKLYSMAAFMWHAERLRKHIPSLKYVWLSTEMQAIVDESMHLKKWTFFYSKNLRQIGAEKMKVYSKLVGLQLITEISFANLIISSQCDGFVGTLGSNWNRLINKLRLTNGRLKAGIAALNFDE